MGVLRLHGLRVQDGLRGSADLVGALQQVGERSLRKSSEEARLDGLPSRADRSPLAAWLSMMISRRRPDGCTSTGLSIHATARNRAATVTAEPWAQAGWCMSDLLHLTDGARLSYFTHS